MTSWSRFLRSITIAWWLSTWGAKVSKQPSKEKPDVIILDIMMPELDGYETCRRLREMPELSKVPIIMLTALSAKEVKNKALEAGANACLSKPCPISVLETVIRENLEVSSQEQSN